MYEGYSLSKVNKPGAQVFWIKGRWESCPTLSNHLGWVQFLIFCFMVHIILTFELVGEVLKSLF